VESNQNAEGYVDNSGKIIQPLHAILHTFGAAQIRLKPLNQKSEIILTTWSISYDGRIPTSLMFKAAELGLQFQHALLGAC